MEFSAANPVARYQAFHKRVEEDVAFLKRRIRSSSRASMTSRRIVVFLIVLASALPLITQIRALQFVPAWSATLAIVLAGGLILFDRYGMWTEDFTRWNDRLMKTMEFKDNFDSKYARIVRLIGESPTPSAEDRLLAHLEDAFRALGTIRQKEALQWSAQYRSVLASLAAEIRGQGGTSEPAAIAPSGSPEVA